MWVLAKAPLKNLILYTIALLRVPQESSGLDIKRDKANISGLFRNIQKGTATWEA